MYRYIYPKPCRAILLQEVMFKTVKYTDSVNSLEMFLKGDYMVKTEQARLWIPWIGDFVFKK